MTVLPIDSLGDRHKSLPINCLSFFFQIEHLVGFFQYLTSSLSVELPCLAIYICLNLLGALDVESLMPRVRTSAATAHNLGQTMFQALGRYPLQVEKNYNCSLPATQKLLLCLFSVSTLRSTLTSATCNNMYNHPMSCA